LDFGFVIADLWSETGRVGAGEAKLQSEIDNPQLSENKKSYKKFVN